MTLVPNVAGEPQRHVPEVANEALEPSPTNVASTPPSISLQCPFSSGPCPVLSRLFEGHSAPLSPAANAWVRELAPCESCRTCYVGGRQSLRGVRLGQREREVLINAADMEVFTLTERGMTRSLSAARRRAAQSLIKAGLVVSAAEHAHARAAVRLTPLGRYIMAAYGRFIRKGKPIRWDRPLARVVVPGVAPEGLHDEALARVNSAMRVTLKELTTVLFVAANRPVKDAARLEEVTRHLEAKAQGLRELLGTHGADAMPG